MRLYPGTLNLALDSPYSTKITVDVRGEILKLKNTINTMVDQLNS